jgi:DNA-binding winged helix-turn-helix (wHTH) protein/Tol biopolymer transport system component
MSRNNDGYLRFGDYEFDSHSGKLLRDGRPIKIQPQPLRVLAVLVEHPGEIVSREQLHGRIWGEATYVEFDQGLNYCIRQIRVALHDEASKPAYVETLPKQGYRFIAPVIPARYDVEASRDSAGPGSESPAAPRRRFGWYVAAAACVALALAAVAFEASLRVRPTRLKFTQLTDFTDSAQAPVLSPDGRMVAFIRGSTGFLSADQVYVKMLPDGDAQRLTDDPRLKYGLAFSPDGSRIAYSVLESPNWKTYTVPVLGGDPQLLLDNAAGVTWLDPLHLLFSRTRSGVHLGIVTGTAARQDFHDLYFPPHERGMAHYSYASPDRTSALVVEMNDKGGWAPCLLISLDGRAQPTIIGPRGSCRAAGWSPDGSWMYFTAVVDGQSHLWRQRFPSGPPEQLTFGPTEEEGVAVELDGRSVITAMGTHESSIWIHDAAGERSLSSEGEIVSRPSFGADDKVLYYLLRRRTAASGPELWRMTIESGKSEAVFPGISMLAFDVSPDGKQLVYSTVGSGGKSQLWLAPIDRSAPAKHIGSSGEASPYFGPGGQILFQLTEGSFDYLEQMNPDGSGRSKVVPYPISDLQGVSPGRRWVMAGGPLPDGSGPAPMAIPVDGGPPRRIFRDFCFPVWSSNGKFLFVPVEFPTRTNPGRSLAIPVGPGEELPEFPPEGIAPGAPAGVMPGAQSVPRGALVPGRDPSHYVYVNTTAHRNLYRITLP